MHGLTMVGVYLGDEKVMDSMETCTRIF